MGAKNTSISICTSGMQIRNEQVCKDKLLLKLGGEAPSLLLMLKESKLNYYQYFCSQLRAQGVMSPFLALRFPVIDSLSSDALRLVRCRIRVFSCLEDVLVVLVACILEFCSFDSGFLLGFQRASQWCDMQLK